MWDLILCNFMLNGRGLVVDDLDRLAQLALAHSLERQELEPQRLRGR